MDPLGMLAEASLGNDADEAKIGGDEDEDKGEDRSVNAATPVAVAAAAAAAAATNAGQEVTSERYFRRKNRAAPFVSGQEAEEERGRERD